MLEKGGHSANQEGAKAPDFLEGIKCRRAHGLLSELQRSVNNGLHTKISIMFLDSHIHPSHPLSPTPPEMTAGSSWGEFGSTEKWTIHRKMVRVPRKQESQSERNRWGQRHAEERLAPSSPGRERRRGAGKACTWHLLTSMAWILYPGPWQATNMKSLSLN